MTYYPTFSPAEEAIIYDTAIAGKKGPAVVEALKAAGFDTYTASVICSAAYRRALKELREKTADAKTAAEPKPGMVVYRDLIIRREVRLVDAHTLNGTIEKRPISVSGGLMWQVPA